VLGSHVDISVEAEDIFLHYAIQLMHFKYQPSFKGVEVAL
jgi:hypothetical protein